MQSKMRLTDKLAEDRIIFEIPGARKLVNQYPNEKAMNLQWFLLGLAFGILVTISVLLIATPKEKENNLAETCQVGGSGLAGDGSYRSDCVSDRWRKSHP